jgi:exopolyphosphatase/pppGpp-phosphohydrolase
MNAVNSGVQAYRQARQLVAANAWVTMLHVGAGESVVAFGHGDEAPVVVDIGIGTATGAMPRHDPPTPLELEHAIAAIEDAVMPLARRLPPSSVLVASGGAMHELALASGGLALADVEHLFQQLAAVAEGRPAVSGGVPSGPAFAATLLIVREFMHHLGFESLVVAG